MHDKTSRWVLPRVSRLKNLTAKAQWARMRSKLKCAIFSEKMPKTPKLPLNSQKLPFYGLSIMFYYILCKKNKPRHLLLTHCEGRGDSRSDRTVFDDINTEDCRDCIRVRWLVKLALSESCVKPIFASCVSVIRFSQYKNRQFPSLNKKKLVRFLSNVSGTRDCHQRSKNADRIT